MLPRAHAPYSVPMVSNISTMQNASDEVIITSASEPPLCVARYWSKLKAVRKHFSDGLRTPIFERVDRIGERKAVDYFFASVVAVAVTDSHEIQ